MKNLVILLFISLIAGCGTSHRIKAGRINNYMMTSDYTSIIKTTTGTKFADKIEIEKTELLDALNSGISLFLTSQQTSAIKMLDHADILIYNNLNEAKAKTTSRDAISVVNNASVFDYQPYVMDDIYLSSYKILSHLANGHKNYARIEVNKAYLKQQNASEYFEKQIEKSTLNTQKELDKLDATNQSLALNNSNKLIESHFSNLRTWNGYKNYMNPYVTYISGLFFLTNSTGRNDFEDAVTYMRRVAGMSPDNQYVIDDLNQAELAANFNSKSKQKHIWVLYENGMVADFIEERFDFPAFIFTDRITTVSYAIPVPRQRDIAFSSLNISLGNQEKNTQILADIDNILIAEYSKKLPSIITKSIAEAIFKTSLQYATDKNYKEKDSDLNALLDMAATIYAISTTQADLRSWHTLPKNVQIAKLKIDDSNNELVIKANTGTVIAKINIQDNANYIVYIRIPSIMSQPVISLIKL